MASQAGCRLFDGAIGAGMAYVSTKSNSVGDRRGTMGTRGQMVRLTEACHRVGWAKGAGEVTGSGTTCV